MYLPITNPKLYIFPIVICVFVLILAAIGIESTPDKANNSVLLSFLSVLMCGGVLGIPVGIIFLVRSNKTLDLQRTKEMQGHIWMQRNIDEHSKNTKLGGPGFRTNKDGSTSYGYGRVPEDYEYEPDEEDDYEEDEDMNYSNNRTRINRSNTQYRKSNRNNRRSEERYDDRPAYYESRDNSEEETGSTILDRVHEEYGYFDLDTNVCTENFSGDVERRVMVDGQEYKLVQTYWMGKMSDEYVTDRDGYSLNTHGEY